MKQKPYRITLEYLNYTADNRQFISVNIDYHNGGSSCPCDSREEAVEHLKRELNRKGLTEKDIELIDKTDLKITIGELLGCNLLSWC